MGALRQPDLAEGHSEEDDRGRLLLWAAVRPSVLSPSHGEAVTAVYLLRQ